MNPPTDAEARQAITTIEALIDRNRQMQRAIDLATQHLSASTGTVEYEAICQLRQLATLRMPEALVANKNQIQAPNEPSERVCDAFVRSANRVYDRLNTGEWSEYQLSAESVQRFRDSIQGLKQSTFMDIVDGAMIDLRPAPKPVDLPAVKAPEVAAAPDPNKQPTKPYHEPAFPLVPSKEMWEMGYGVQTGMTLHDWYAGQALAGYGGTEFGSVEMGARFFFDLADAMMAERARRAKAT